MSLVLSEALQVLSRTPVTLRALLDGLDDEWLAADEGPARSARATSSATSSTVKRRTGCLACASSSSTVRAAPSRPSTASASRRSTAPVTLSQLLEQKAAGRRAFWRAAAQGLDLDRLQLETCVPRSIGGAPVRGGIVGIGRQGKVMLSHCVEDVIDIQAICDVNPAHLSQASDTVLTTTGRRPRAYADWQEMAEKEDLEAVIIATPLWTHAEITGGFLDAAVHVLCEKMMAYDTGGGLRMLDAARRNRRLLEIAYPRFYEPMYQAAYRNIIEPELLGDIHFVRLTTHRNSNWRFDEKPPTPAFDPRRWGYPTWDHLVETDDHIHATFEFPKGCTAELSVILSNRYGGLYEEFLGTKGSLVLSDQDGAMLFTNEPGRGNGKIPERRDEAQSPDRVS